MATRKVFARDTRFDAIKAAIAIGAVGLENRLKAREWAVNRYGIAGAPDGYDVEDVLEKGAIGALSTGTIDSSSSTLADRDLFAAVRERSALFRMRGIRKTGFQGRGLALSGSTSTWVKQGSAIPVSKPLSENPQLRGYKLASMVVASKEALESSPGIEVALFNDIATSYANSIDAALFDPTNAGIANVKPAALTNGITAVTATSDMLGDLTALVDDFGGDLTQAVFVMNPRTAVRLTPSYENVGARGGELLGLPVLTSSGAPTTSVALLDPTGIMAAWDDYLVVEIGENGSIEMSDAPTGSLTTPAAGAVLSLFQANAVAFRAISRIDWTRALDGSVSVLQGGGTGWLS